MADYREITQEYAKGAIKTVILVNAGGIIATLNQLSEVLKFASPYSLKWAMVIWVIGIVFGVASWALGYMSTTQFGNSDEIKMSANITRSSQSEKYNDRANKYANRTAIAILMSLVCFVTGCLLVIFGFGSEAITSMKVS